MLCPSTKLIKRPKRCFFIAAPPRSRFRLIAGRPATSKPIGVFWAAGDFDGRDAASPLGERDREGSQPQRFSGGYSVEATLWPEESYTGISLHMSTRIGLLMENYY